MAYSPSFMRTRPTQARVSLDAITHNLQTLRARAPHSKLMATLKADAYGHGMVEVAQHLSAQQVDALAVAYLEEGITLRTCGIQTPILVLGAILDHQIEQFIAHDLEITASSMFKARRIHEVATTLGKAARVHFKVDSGMQRIGVRLDNALTFIQSAAALFGLEPVGVFSHLVDAQAQGAPVATQQTEAFLKLRQALIDRGYKLSFHLANSAGLFYLPKSHLDMVRPGLALYGVGPVPESAALNLRPALSICTQVAFVKGLRQGWAVGYDHTWQAPCDGWLATLPVGYADGYVRALSNRAFVLIGGQKRPVVGQISMDQCTVWLGPDRCEVGDACVLLGEQDGARIDAWELAQHAGTIPYELLCGWSGRVPRSYEPGVAYSTR